MHVLRPLRLLMMSLLALPAFAELPSEKLFEIEQMPSRDGRHIVVLSDFSVPFATDGRAHIVDADNGTYLGSLSTGYWYSGVNLPATRNVLVSPETYFSRGTRGQRTDVVTFYDGNTLSPMAEVEIPPKRFTAVKMQGTSLLTDDDRFLMVLNHTPAASVSVVDLEKQAFVTEIEVPGCFNIYPTGTRSFNSICGDGAFLQIALDDSGNPVSMERTDPLFDPVTDPLTVSGVRSGDSWFFVSQAGYLHEIEMTAEGVTAKAPWSLFTEEQRGEQWGISGFQHLALHARDRRLYLLTHQGPPETFEDPGTHVWVFDLDRRALIEKRKLDRMALSIEVSQDEQPQLYALAAEFNMPDLFQLWIYLTEGSSELEKHMSVVLDVYAAHSGALLHSVQEIGEFPSYIQLWPATVTAND
jgi:methylamine dehydrogenase heavy chain